MPARYGGLYEHTSMVLVFRRQTPSGGVAFLSSTIPREPSPLPVRVFLLEDEEAMTIVVRFQQRGVTSYPVYVGSGFLGRLPEIVSGIAPGRRTFLITDATVARLYGRGVHHAMLSRGIDAVLLDFPPGEASKCVDVVHTLQTHLLAAGIQRDDLVVALGGGVVGDVAGFVAATILRGVRVIQVPTTVLAQLDSSVGGKVGIDHPAGKNLIGAFHHPSAVVIDPDVLGSLPEPEFANGLAEGVKIAAALDASLFRWLERNTAGIRARRSPALVTMISRCVGLKAAVVHKDEHESGVRRSLNLGHTIGHALEVSCGYRLPHGAAVSMGIAAESAFAVRLGLLRANDRRQVVALLRSFGLATRLPVIRSRSRFHAALAVDKKNAGARTAFVLLRGIGRCAIGVGVPSDFVDDLLSGRR
jgi:3-dehydroquinate synthase